MATPPPLPIRRTKQTKNSSEDGGFWSHFNNALLSWEILRAGRRTGQLALARTVLGASLLIAMWLLWNARFDYSTETFTGSGTEIGKKLSRFAESFAVTFFVVQAITVLLLTPVFVAGAIFEERETRSGEILLTTRLTRREVYVGKVGARIVQVLLVVAAGIPILFLTQLWGGVAPELIAVCYFAICVSTVGAGTVTAAVSAYAETMRGAILKSYCFIFLFDFVVFPASPLFIISLASGHWIAALFGMILYLPLQFGLVIASYLIGQRWLRLAMLRQKKKFAAWEITPPPLPDGKKNQSLTTISDDISPLLWKELYANQRLKWSEIRRNFFVVNDRPIPAESIQALGLLRWCLISPHGLAFMFRVSGVLMIAIVLALLMTRLISPPDFISLMGAILLLWLMSSIGLSAASSVSQERQKQTLIDLLMLPGPRREILWAKFIGSLAHGLIPGTILATVVVFVYVAGGIVIWAIPMALLFPVALAIFSGAFGIWLSIQCRSIVQSNVLLIGFFAIQLIGTYLLAEMNLRWNVAGENTFPMWSRVVNPLMTWNRLIVSHSESQGYVWYGSNLSIPYDSSTYLMACVGSIVLLVFATIFGFLAVRQFEKEGR